MKNLLRNSKWISVILGVCAFVSCVRLGPVNTELRDAYPKKNDPKEFQSPLDAIRELHDELTSNLSDYKNNHEVTSYYRQVLRVLEAEQAHLERKLQKDGTLLLKPGRSYSFELESFCVHAGQERPITGDGFRAGPVKGPAKSWLPAILQRYKKSGISQSDTQTLIWSLLAGSRFDELSNIQKKHALKMFPDAPIRFGNSLAEEKAVSFFQSLLPNELNVSVDTLNEYKNMLNNASSSYQELAEIMAPISSRSQPMKMGWVETDQHYFVRISSIGGYSGARIDVYVPQSITHEILLDPSTLLAIPGMGQRLAISANKLEEWYRDSGNKLLNRLAERELAAEEQRLIREHPIDAVKIAINMKKAFMMTEKNFPGMNPHNTEADAFRHFVWSAMNAQDVGKNRAREFMEAHESDPNQPARERTMDSWNNEQGMDYGGNSRSRGSIDLENEGKKRIKEGRLKIRP